MKQSKPMFASEVFLGSNIVRKFTFKTINTGDSCALLAVLNHQLAMTLVTSRGQSAYFEKLDCFECLSPHEIAA
ncbi:MAG: hypothetical protein FWE06_05635 [Oscillospiraceae bacterium]|nr:hypothetical protein [Oscillospiraceae bacterium]